MKEVDHRRPGVCKLLELALKRNMQESGETKQDGDSVSAQKTGMLAEMHKVRSTLLRSQTD